MLTRKYSGTQGGTVYISKLFEKNVDTGAVTKYYYAEGQRIAMRSSGTLNYLTNNQQGSTLMVTTASAPISAVARLRYYPLAISGGPPGHHPPTMVSQTFRLSSGEREFRLACQKGEALFFAG